MAISDPAMDASMKTPPNYGAQPATPFRFSAGVLIFLYVHASVTKIAAGSVNWPEEGREREEDVGQEREGRKVKRERG